MNHSLAVGPPPMLQSSPSRVSSLDTLLPLFLISISIKLLLFPAPHSTDLDVHRFWKSLTYHKPLSAWYEDTSSEWTLDYPPLFAYFEWILSRILTLFDSSLTDPARVEEHTGLDIVVLRGSVLFCEPLLLYAIHKLAGLLAPQKEFEKTVLAYALPGLTLVDNIHFQYNALPLSVFLLSIYYLSLHNIHIATFLFCVTLNLKQTFLPLLPVYIITILTLINRKPHLVSKLATLFTVSLTAVLSLLFPWLPFIFTAGVEPLLERLFPLQRGLLHANWAPNIWAPYATLDRLLTYVSTMESTPSTRGIINIMQPFTILPNPTPVTCMLLTLLSTLPFIIHVVRHPNPQTVTVGVTASALSAFVFGWHVHEKAILLALLPLSLTPDHDAFIWLSLGGQFALFELLRYPQMTVFLIAHFIAFHAALFAMYRTSRAAVAYFVGCFVVEAYCGVLGIHRLIFGQRLQFFPIMLVSLYAFIGVGVGYGVMLRRALQAEKTD